VSLVQHFLGSNHNSQTLLTSSLLTASRQQSSSRVTAFRKGQSSGRSSSRILKTSTPSSRIMD